MQEIKGSTSISPIKKGWIWPWLEDENLPTVLPKSKSGRLAQRAKLANIEAEKAVGRAYQAEVARTKAVSEAMFKSGKALKFTLISSSREILLRAEAARRQFEPGYRNR